MKIAILLSGEYRSFNICRPTMTFLDDLDVDVYVSTWDITHHVRPGINLSEYEKITENQITQLLGRPATIKIESATIQHTLPKHYNCSMIHRWKYGFDLIQNSGIKYDYVIITRFDLCFDPVYPIDIKKNLHLFIESLGSSWTREGKLGDLFMVSSYHKMKEFMNNLTIEKWIAGPEPDWHTWFYDFAKSVFSEVINYTNIHYTICRYLSNQGDTYEQVLEHHYDWRDVQLVEFLIENPEVHGNVWSPEIRQNALDKWHSGYFDKYMQPNRIAELSGFSGSSVNLMKNYTDGTLFVRKQGDITRNYEKLSLLSTNNFIVPKIYNKTSNILDMEYVAGIDMKSFLLINQVRVLSNFISDTMQRFMTASTPKDYSETYMAQLSAVDYSHLPFTLNELYSRLPKVLPQSLCHGDFTLENLIYSKDSQFYMIDTVTGPYDSWVFDIAKMRQDFEGHWFIRNTQIDLSVQLKILHDYLYLKFSEAFDDSLYILMLLRVYKHCHAESKEHLLIKQEIHRIWN
jgi:hypothetical protein